MWPCAYAWSGLLPAACDRAVDLELPRVARAADVVAAAAAVIDRAACGDISLAEAREFMALLAGVIETAEWTVRIEALERQATPTGLAGFASNDAVEYDLRWDVGAERDLLSHGSVSFVDWVAVVVPAVRGYWRAR